MIWHAAARWSALIAAQPDRVTEDMHTAPLRIERDAASAEGLDTAAARLELGGGGGTHVAVIAARRTAHQAR